MEEAVKNHFKRDLDKFLAALFGLVMGFIQFIYWYEVSSLVPEYIGDDVGRGFWRYSPSGTLFPWPSRPGEIVDAHRLGTMDQMIFAWFDTGLYIVIAIAIIFLFVLIGLYLGKYLKIKYQFENAPDYIFPKPKSYDDLQEYGKLALYFSITIWIMAIILILTCGFIGFVICLVFGPFLILPALVASLFARSSNEGKIGFVFSLIAGVLWLFAWIYIKFNPIYYT